MHIALSKHHEARGGDRAQARETGVPHGGRLKRARQWLRCEHTWITSRLVKRPKRHPGFYIRKTIHKNTKVRDISPMTQPVIGEAFSLPSRLDNMKTNTRIFLVYLRKCKYMYTCVYEHELVA
jgi:hypothetical protein